MTPELDPLSYTLCTFHEGEMDYAKQIFQCEPRGVMGRYVIIQIQSEMEPYLQLCEVEVYEEVGSV